MSKAKKANELPGMPDMDSVGKKAVELLRKRNDLANVKKEIGDEIELLEAALITAMEATGRDRIKVENKIFRIEVSEKKTIKVDRAKAEKD